MQNLKRINRKEYEELLIKLEEAEAIINAIRNGEVDALIINEEIPQIYTLKGAEQPYHILVDNLNEGAVTVANDNTILYCNKRFSKMLDISIEEIIGKPITNFILIDSHFLSDNSTVQKQLILFGKNNKAIPVLVSINPLNFHEFSGFGLLFTDLTEILEVTKEKAKMASIVQSTDDAVISVAPDCKILSWNKGAEEIFGYKAAEIIGESIKILLPENKLHEHNEMLQKLTSGIPLRHVETERKRKDGTIIHVSLTVSILRDSNNKIYGYAKIARDITEKKLAEEKIRKLNEDLENQVNERTKELTEAIKDVESFSYSVSHDLRAPLRRIETFSKIIQQRYINSLDEKANEYFSFIIENVENMSKLVDNLLTFSHLTVKNLDKEIVDINKLIADVLKDLKPFYENRNIDFKITEMPPVYCDYITMKQVWTNLLSNAIKFTSHKDPGKIQISGSNLSSEYIYTIKDNGAGFDMQFANKLFIAFQRLHTDEEFKGTGVGLSLVERIITKHGGRIWAEGKVGEGATFTFTLPC